jgi:hypothetical protein
MTPKEKANELYDKYFFPHYIWKNDGYQVDEKLTYELRKKFALIAVDEILESNPLEPNDTEDWLQPEDWFSSANISAEKYWQEVKQEIEKL